MVTVFIGEDVDPLKGGNPLAVFPDAEKLSGEQMQALAQTMNLSESTFVTSAKSDGYSVRIFTPGLELPFAGHPTIGTSWLLRRIDRLSGNRFIQTSGAGDTEVTMEGDDLWFERTGHVDRDIEASDPDAQGAIAAALGLDLADVGVDAEGFGGSGDLKVAASDAGVEQLMVPLRDDSALGRCSPRSQVGGGPSDGRLLLHRVGRGADRSPSGSFRGRESWKTRPPGPLRPGSAFTSGTGWAVAVSRSCRGVRWVGRRASSCGASRGKCRSADAASSSTKES